MIWKACQLILKKGNINKRYIYIMGAASFNFL